MSMYGMLFGQNKHADIILVMLNLTRGDTGRFRDAFVSDGKIAVYTRNGGGNRDDYQHVFDKLRAHPQYLHDEDDDFDCTYATIWFKVPDEWVLLATALESGTFNPDTRWQDMIEGLKHETPDSLQTKYPALIKLLERIQTDILASTPPGEG